MDLTLSQKQHLYEQGYVLVPGVIPRERVNAAMRAINHSLGEGLDPAKLAILRSQSYAPELQREAVITDLYNATPAKGLVESLIGSGKVRPVTGGQIALRFPIAPGQTPGQPSPHLDGMYTPTNGVPQGRIASFTMLVGVALSDVSEPFAGNLTVWPGTHRLYEQYFREHGPEALLQGMPPIRLPEPLFLTAQAGDVMLCHYELAHAAAANASPHVRYAIYFRASHVEHDQQWKEAMTDIWMEWPGMRSLIDN
ncbi:MAG TPA: phytanoyl-CoA dioxygenase family protein [Anaerolineae bacterium]|jgi:hypothetical protein